MTDSSANIDAVAKAIYAVSRKKIAEAFHCIEGDTWEPPLWDEIEEVERQLNREYAVAAVNAIYYVFDV